MGEQMEALANKWHDAWDFYVFDVYQSTPDAVAKTSEINATTLRIEKKAFFSGYQAALKAIEASNG